MSVIRQTAQARDDAGIGQRVVRQGLHSGHAMGHPAPAGRAKVVVAQQQALVNKALGLPGGDQPQYGVSTAYELANGGNAGK